MSEINTNVQDTSVATEENVLQSIEELGGIPTIEVEMEVSGMTAYPTDKTLSIQDMPADAAAVGDAIDLLQSATASEAEAIAEIQEWTGENIPVNSESPDVSIADALEQVAGDTYPVGSIYMTVLETAPAFVGTWVEVAITATWTQLKAGTRSYAPLESGATTGTVHFWLRTA